MTAVPRNADRNPTAIQRSVQIVIIHRPGKIIQLVRMDLVPGNIQIITLIARYGQMNVPAGIPKLDILAHAFHSDIDASAAR